MRDRNWKSEFANVFINSFIFNTLHGLNSLSIFTSIMCKKNVNFPGRTNIATLSRKALNNSFKCSNLLIKQMEQSLNEQFSPNIEFIFLILPGMASNILLEKMWPSTWKRISQLTSHYIDGQAYSTTPFSRH